MLGGVRADVCDESAARSFLPQTSTVVRRRLDDDRGLSGHSLSALAPPPAAKVLVLTAGCIVVMFRIACLALSAFTGADAFVVRAGVRGIWS